MARRSGGRSAPRPAPRPAARSAPPPARQTSAPPPAPVQSGGILSGIGSTIAQGMAFGTGSAIAHRAVDAIAGPRTVQHEMVNSSDSPTPAAAPTGSDACSVHSQAFQDCINHNGSDISRCQFYLDMLTECRRGSSSVVSL